MAIPDSSQHEPRRPGLSLLAKAEGAFLALAAGDALGWPQEMPGSVRKVVSANPQVEFTQWTRRSGGRFHPFEEVIHAGDYSDDTQLTLAVARSRANHGPAWWKALTRVELPLWTLYERGGGGATRRAAAAWADGRPPWKSTRKNGVRQYFEAGGNGVAMRALPHALFLAGQESAATLIHDVILDGSATHGHPRALVGAAAYAYAAWSLTRNRSTLRFGELLELLIDQAPEWSRLPKSERRGGSWFEAAEEATDGRYGELWENTVCEMRELLEAARKGLQAGALADDHSTLQHLGCFGRTKGAGTSSAAAAAYLAARHAAQPVQGILRAAFEKGADTDTLAAMAGGLLGCLAGVEWLPSPWLQVQDAKYLRAMAAKMADGPQRAGHDPVATSPVGAVHPVGARKQRRRVRIEPGRLRRRARFRCLIQGPSPSPFRSALGGWPLTMARPCTSPAWSGLPARRRRADPSPKRNRGAAPPPGHTLRHTLGRTRARRPMPLSTRRMPSTPRSAISCALFRRVAQSAARTSRQNWDLFQVRSPSGLNGPRRKG